MADHVKISTEDNQALSGILTTPNTFSSPENSQFLVIMVHGFPGDKDGHEGIFSNLASQLKARGYSSLTFDCRGCGKSGGKQEDYSLTNARKDIFSAVRWAKMKGYKRFIFIGEGIGAVLPLMDFDKTAACFIMLWPVLDMPYFAQALFDSENIEEQWKKAGYIIHENTRVSTELIYELENTSLVSTLKKTKRPLLIMHGARDETAPIDRLDLLRNHIGSRRVEITSFEDGTHGLPKDNHRKSMYYHVLQFIEKYT